TSCTSHDAKLGYPAPAARNRIMAPVAAHVRYRFHRFHRHSNRARTRESRLTSWTDAFAKYRFKGTCTSTVTAKVKTDHAVAANETNMSISVPTTSMLQLWRAQTRVLGRKRPEMGCFQYSS